MSVLALGTPVLALALILLLQRMEDWSLGADHRPSPPGPAARVAPHPTAPPRGEAMPVLSEPHAARPADAAAEPLLRDPPPPPGYVDPLAGSAALEDLVAGRAVPPRSSRARRAPAAGGTASG